MPIVISGICGLCIEYVFRPSIAKNILSDTISFGGLRAKNSAHFCSERRNSKFRNLIVSETQPYSSMTPSSGRQ